MLFDDLLQDLRIAFRSLRKTPGTTALVLVALAVAIGANAAIFSVVDGVLLEPLPWPGAHRLAYLDESYRGTQSKSVSYLNWRSWREMSRTFEDLAARTYWSFNLTGDGEAAQLSTMLISANLLGVLGVEPARGRGFTRAEVERRERVVLLSHALWRTRYGADPGVIDRTLELDDEPWVVVGVMPPGLEFPLAGVDLYAPITVLSEADRSNRGSHPGIGVIGRLQDGATLEEARSDMDRLAAALVEAYPETNAEAGVRVFSLQERQVGPARSTLVLLMAAVGLVLLMACLNVANLLMVRSAQRRREAAVRTALGASRLRLVRQLLTESLVIAGVGGLLGMLLGWLGLDLIRALTPATVPRLDRVGLDGSVLAFALGLTLISGGLVGILPALRVSPRDPARSLAGGADRTRVGGGRRLRATLVVGEVALACMLLVGSGLMLRSMSNLLATDPGLDPENVLTAYVPLSLGEYPTVDDRSLFYGRLLERVRALPGVVSAGGGDPLPLDGYDRQWSVTPADGTAVGPQGHRTDQAHVTPGYFETLRIPLLSGRRFVGTERSDRPVAIVDETLAELLWPGEEAVGKRLKFGGTDSENPWVLVIGVVGHVKNYGVQTSSREQIYLPYTTNVWGLSLVARTAVAPSSVVPAVRERLAALDADVPLTRVATMKEYFDESVAAERLTSRMLSLFGAVALLMALVGLYGVVSHTVQLRTREIGVRRALGARSRSVMASVLRDALGLAALGAALGLAGALGVTRLLAGLLHGVEPGDPVTLALVAALLVIVAVVAAAIPARRAATVSPKVALRE